MEQSNETNELIADVREQVLYLQELGVEALDVRIDDIALAHLRVKSDNAVWVVGNRTGTVPPKGISDLRSEISDKEVPDNKDERPAAGSRLASLPSLSKRPVNKFFDKYNPEETAADVGPAVDMPLTEPVGDALVVQTGSPILRSVATSIAEPVETIEDIRADIGPDCVRCKLSGLGRSKVVNSVGNFNADLMFVGEAPGADEDAKGEPFVGRAGQLLTDIIRAIGFEREEVFIGNINRCRPPGNRTPNEDESVVCKPFLVREIAVVRPKVVVVLGAHAAQNLLETKTPIGKLRGRFHDRFGVRVMPTFHPAYLLRDPHKKREVWDDMKMVRDYLREKL
ncbi:MAG: uracil-DNA glycosylase family protein [Pyrinomonadaceae bacterium]